MKISESGKKIAVNVYGSSNQLFDKTKSIPLGIVLRIFHFLFSESFKLDRDKEVGLKFFNAISVGCFN